MQKSKALALLRNNGDSTIIFRDKEAIVGTTDFSTPYIKNNKKFKRFYIDGKSPSIQIWDWTNNYSRVIKCSEIKKIIPLSITLGNIKNGEQKETESW